MLVDDLWKTLWESGVSGWKTREFERDGKLLVEIKILLFIGHL